MAPTCLLALLLLLLGGFPAAPAESIRETEVINPQDLQDNYSGALPDDEDGGSDDFELSGSGDQGTSLNLSNRLHPVVEDRVSVGKDPECFSSFGKEKYWLTSDTEETKTFPRVIPPLVSLNNHIPERAQPGIRVPSEPKDLEENEVIPKRVSPSEVDGDISNKVSMSSTAQDSNIFERTEVLAALIVGGVVGILFAVFLILLLVYRMKKKDEGSYDLGKKPIYKKAPTNEFYA